MMLKKIILPIVILTSLCLLFFLLLNEWREQENLDIPKAESYKLNQTIYYNGDIITMEGSEPEYVEAVVQREGQIIFVGSKDEAFKRFEGKAKKHDLGGETMLPGFIEPHAHPVSIGALLLAHDIVAPHEWRMPHKTFPAVVGHDNYLKALKEVAESKVDKTKTALIWGYHQSWHGSLTPQELNAATGDVPTVIFHRSGHEMFLNNAAMKKYKVDVTKFENQDQIDIENQHFWERGFQELRAGPLASLYANKESLSLGLKRLSQLMLQNGLTAMAEPSFPNGNFKDEYELLKAETERSPYYDMYLIPGFPEQYNLKMSNEDFDAYIKKMKAYDTDHIKFMTRQYKSFVDGAIYSLALQLVDGFENCPDCHAEWIIPPDQHSGLFNYYWDNGYKIHLHITGDLGLEKSLDMLEAAIKRNPRENHRTTFHHLGLFSEAQAKRMAKLGVEASVNSYYLWALGNKYGEVGFGHERAKKMAAVKWLVDNGIVTSYHSDFAMAPAEPLTLAWVAATRTTDSGKALRPELGVSVYEAMKGITIHAARTIDMEEKIGSIKEGKVANFTLLKQNPFKIDPEKLKDIPVSGIVYKGKFRVNKATNHKIGD